MKILIIGGRATGQITRQTIDCALQANHEVTAFGRHIWRIYADHPNLSGVQGDVLDDNKIDQAIRGQDAVILGFGVPLNAGTVLHRPNIAVKATKNVIAAMQHHKVPRLDCLTALGAGDSKGHGRLVFRRVIEPVLFGRIMQDRTAQEEAIRASELPEWVIVRPAELSDNEPAPVRIIEDIDSEPEPTTISRQDVARTLVDLLVDKRYDGRAIVISNGDGQPIEQP